jgi:hypothetical protein
MPMSILRCRKHFRGPFLVLISGHVASLHDVKTLWELCNWKAYILQFSQSNLFKRRINPLEWWMRLEIQLKYQIKYENSLNIWMAQNVIGYLPAVMSWINLHTELREICLEFSPMISSDKILLSRKVHSVISWNKQQQAFQSQCNQNYDNQWFLGEAGF